MREKGFAFPLVLVVVALVLVVFGAAVYFLLKPKPSSQQPIPISQQTQTPQATSPSQENDTANWKTYRNEEYGFEVRYPNEYTLYQIQDVSDEFYVNIVTLRNVTNANEIGLQVIHNIDIYEGLNSQRVLEREINDSPCSYTVSRLSIDDYDAAEAISSDCIDTVVLVRSSTKNLFVWLNFKNDHPKYNQILSTFKFL